MKEMPIRFILSDGMDFLGDMICCPVCGFEYVHPWRVLVMQGAIATEVTCEQSHTYGLPKSEMMKRRGSKIVLNFYCESGHSFGYEMQFHKGCLYCKLFSADCKQSDDEGEEFEAPDELWRD